MTPVVILDLGGERYHFGDLTDMVLWLDATLGFNPDALNTAGMFWWSTLDLLPFLGCVDYKEEGES